MPPGEDEEASPRARSGPVAGRRSVATTTPRDTGEQAASERRRPRWTRPARHRVNCTRSRPIHSSSSPRLRRRCATAASLPHHLGRPSERRRAVRPRARTTTTTPTRSATEMARRPGRTAESRSSVAWSPGRTPRSAPARTAIATECDRESGSGCARPKASRPAPLAPTAGHPSTSSESPARETRTSSGALPVFATRITARADAGTRDAQVPPPERQAAAPRPEW